MYLQLNIQNKDLLKPLKRPQLNLNVHQQNLKSEDEEDKVVKPVKPRIDEDHLIG